MSEAQATLAHYGERFDKPFLATRALIHGLAPPPPVKLIDTWKYAYKQLSLTSNRLETLSYAMGTNKKKYKLPFEVWQLADHGDKKLLKEMQAYCENDVDTLIDVYTKMRPIIHDHPNVTGAAGAKHWNRKKGMLDCRVCDKRPSLTQARGHRFTKSFRIERWQCRNCGSFFDGRQEKL